MSHEPSVLQTAVKEIVAALLAADWVRFSDGKDGPFYYVIRETDRQIHDELGDAWDEVSLPADGFKSDFEDWYVRTVLAESTRDHFDRLSKQLKLAGYPPKEVDALIEAARSADSRDALLDAGREWAIRLYHPMAKGELDPIWWTV